MMLLSVAFAAALAAPAPAAPPAAAPVPFTGRTTGEGTVVPDAVEEIRHFAHQALKCDSLTGVKVTALPKNWEPADRNFRIGVAGARYERWDAKLCGRVVPFLVSFWDMTKYGPQFRVARPFPRGRLSRPS